MKVVPGGTISHDGDTWTIISTGRYQDGTVYCHLASTTRSRQQRNGSVPAQICDWIPVETVESAAGKPRGYYTWNKALQGAYSKGQEARQEDQTIEACPYRDKRKNSGRLTWSRSFIAAWRDGWRDEDEKIKRAAITSYYQDKTRPGQPPAVPR